MDNNNNSTQVDSDLLWYVDNYILLKDYYERTISRIAARCVRMGNIAMEDYPYYSYILDVLDEISETGDFILEHTELASYVEQKIKGGMQGLKKDLKDYKHELQNNASPEMIKEDALEVERLKKALGATDKSIDPTVGAGMNVEELMDKLLNQNEETKAAFEDRNQTLSEDHIEQPLSEGKNEE